MCQTNTFITITIIIRLHHSIMYVDVATGLLLQME